MEDIWVKFTESLYPTLVLNAMWTEMFMFSKGEVLNNK